MWALALDIGRSTEAYARRVAELVELIGEDHVGFGTDINGLGPNAIFQSYADLRRVVEHLKAAGLGEARIAKIAIGNYARVLAAALQPRPA